jgi:hypothetical protein
VRPPLPEDDNPLVTMQAFLLRLRQAKWPAEAIGHVNNATRRMIAIIYEPESAESADELQLQD